MEKKKNKKTTKKSVKKRTETNREINGGESSSRNIPPFPPEHDVPPFPPEHSVPPFPPEHDVPPFPPEHDVPPLPPHHFPPPFPRHHTHHDRMSKKHIHPHFFPFFGQGRMGRFRPPPIPISPSKFKEIMDLLFLWSIKENPSGITGYKLQSLYSIPQTNVYRILNNLEKRDLIISEETIQKGRAQRLFKISNKGIELLDRLRKDWSLQISFLNEIIPPEPFGKSYFKKLIKNNLFIKSISDKEQLIELLEIYNIRLLQAEEKAQKHLKSIQNSIEFLKEKIEILKTQSIDKDKLKSIINEITDNFI